MRRWIKVEGGGGEGEHGYTRDANVDSCEPGHKRITSRTSTENVTREMFQERESGGSRRERRSTQGWDSGGIVGTREGLLTRSTQSYARSCKAHGQ